MLRRIVSALLVTATAAAGTLLVVGPAQAAEECRLAVPARLSVKHVRTVIYGSVAGACRRNDGYASWEMLRDGAGSTLATFAQYDQRTDPARAVIDIDAAQVQWGRHTFRPAGASGTCAEATDFEDCDLTQNAPRIDVRLSSASGVAGRRVKKRVTLTGASAVFSTTAGRYARHSARGQFQWRARGGAWHGLRSVTTSRSGLAQVRVKAHKGRQYRFVTLTAAHWWASGSRVVAP